MSLVQTVAPTTAAVSTADAKTHLRIDHSEDDTYIASLVEAATQYVQQVTWRQLMTATYALRLDAWPSCQELYLPRPPLLTVSSITYVDNNGATQTWSSSYYVVDTYSEPGRIYLAYNETFPSSRGYLNNIVVTYTAGYGAAASAIPGDIVHAIKLLVGHWYWNREAVVTGTITANVPLAVGSLLAPYRMQDERVLEYVA